MANSSSRRKLLLMGRSGSGKSSMRSIIFSNYSAFDTRRLGATIDVEHSHLRFLGHMTLNLWDCGGQDAFVDNYFTTQRDHIFRMVEVLIHVFDVESDEISKDIDTFTRGLKHLNEYSPNAKVFVLIHKMDLVQTEKREEVFINMMRALQETTKQYNFHLTGFPTSIWDESLYKAWSSIVCSLIPNMTLFQKSLKRFAEITEAEEVILFEKTTFLVISHVSLKGAGTNELDPNRFEKISNIIKSYKQSCSKMRSQFSSLTLKGINCHAVIETLTPNTFVMIILPNLSISLNSQDNLDSNKNINTNDTLENDDGSVLLMNIKVARKWFEKIELQGSSK